jgi:hypothetical protein
MARVVLSFILILQVVAVEGSEFQKCLVCHENSAPPLAMVYRRYLMLYSSKSIIKERMIEFLTAPSKKKSSMPEGMKRRFYPENHPKYSLDEIKKSVNELIKREDIIPKIALPK